PTNCDAHLAESLFQTRSRINRGLLLIKCQTHINDKGKIIRHCHIDCVLKCGNGEQCGIVIMGSVNCIVKVQ
ncbi:DUF6783 domain-containing protein, partial [Blautia glucerasea]|uniref:DUF6783 domain-containing protein n=1 Tax=Blautia glucerasea TaxID=536633 RepID=UPI003B51F91E